MKCQKSVNEFRNESIYEIERNKPMVKLDTHKCQVCILHVSQNCRMRKCQKPKMLERKYITEVTPLLVFSNPKSTLKNARKSKSERDYKLRNV